MLNVPPPAKIKHFHYLRNLRENEEEAIIAEYSLEPAESRVKVNLAPMVRVAFSQRPAEGCDVLDVLREIRDHISSFTA